MHPGQGLHCSWPCMFSLSCMVSELIWFLCSLMSNEMLSLQEILHIPSNLYSATATSYSCCCCRNEKINFLPATYFLINIADIFCYYVSVVALTLQSQHSAGSACYYFIFLLESLNGVFRDPDIKQTLEENWLHFTLWTAQFTTVHCL